MITNASPPDATPTEPQTQASTGDAPSPPASESQASRISRLKELVFKIRLFGFKVLPSVFSHPAFEGHERYWRERDPINNKESSPPEGESVRLHCLWVAEIYAPSDTQILVKSLRNLGWANDDIQPGSDAIEWIQRSRALSLAGGWLNLGYVKRPGTRQFGRLHTAPLPDQVDHLTGSVYNLTSGITCVVMNFVFNDATSQLLDQCLRQDRETYSVPTKHGYRIVEPTQQKIEHLRSIRKELRSSAADWFRKYMPGVFSRGVLGGEFPTCEFLTLQIATPFPSREDDTLKGLADEYLRILGLKYGTEGWNSTKIQGLKFVQPRFDDDGLRHHNILAIRESDFAKIDLSAWGGYNPSSYVAYLDHTIGGTMSRWGLLALLSGYERKLNEVRDSTIFSSEIRKKPLRVLDNLGQLVGNSIDISTIASDLRDLADKKWLFNYGIGDFVPARPEIYRDKDATLEEVLRKTVADRSVRLYESERIVRDLLVQHGTMLGTAENVRLQGKVTFLTWVLVVLTILIAILTAAMVPDAALREILDWINTKYSLIQRF